MSLLRSQFFVVAALASVLALDAEGRFQVNQYDQHEQTSPAVAMNADGEFVVVWRSHANDGRRGGIYARCYSGDGAATCDEFQINVTDVDVDSWTPAVAMKPSGDFVVAWVAARDGDSDIVARMFDRQGGALTEEVPVSLAPDAAQSAPAISMNDSGSFVLVWTGRFGDAVRGRTYISGRIFDPNGSPRTDEFRVNGDAQEDWPDVAMDDNGRFVVSWIRMGDTYNRPYGEYVMYRRFDAAGRPVGAAISLTGDLNSRWYGPAVAAGRDGGFMIAWAVGPFPYDIVAQGFDANGVATAQPFTVNTCVEGNQGRPAIAGDGQGDFVIAWDNQCPDGVRCGVSARLCTCGGPFQGQELVLCEPQSWRQWYPKVAMAGGGQYVIVWTGQTSDSSYDIYAQIGSAQ